MASELEIPYGTAGLTTVYAIVRSGSSFVTASTGALQAATAANWATSAVALSDTACAGDYVANMPASTPAGAYTYNVYLKLGGSYANTDTLLGVTPSPLIWNGTALIVPDKTGVSLSATGLDAIAVTAPSGAPTTFTQMMVMLYRRFFKKTTLTATTLTTYADDGTTSITAQTVSDNGTTQTQGTA